MLLFQTSKSLRKLYRVEIMTAQRTINVGEFERESRIVRPGWIVDQSKRSVRAYPRSLTRAVVSPPVRPQQLGNFEIVRKLLFPIWLGLVPVFFLYLEVRKQFARVSTRASHGY